MILFPYIFTLGIKSYFSGEKPRVQNHSNKKLGLKYGRSKKGKVRAYSRQSGMGT